MEAKDEVDPTPAHAWAKEGEEGRRRSSFSWNGGLLSSLKEVGGEIMKNCESWGLNSPT